MLKTLEVRDREVLPFLTNTAQEARLFVVCKEKKAFWRDGQNVVLCLAALLGRDAGRRGLGLLAGRCGLLRRRGYVRELFLSVHYISKLAPATWSQLEMPAHTLRHGCHRRNNLNAGTLGLSNGNKELKSGTLL